MDVPDFVDALAQLAWPAVVGVLAWKLEPTLATILRTRDITVKGPGEMELTVGGKAVSPQRAVDDQRRQTEDLRTELSRLSAVVTQLHAATLEGDFRDGAEHTRRRAREALGRPFVQRLLWVDDQPANNAYEIGALQDRGIDVVEATSTAEGLGHAAGGPSFDAVISDMSRMERGTINDTAGIELLDALRKRSPTTPTFVYCAPGSLARYADKIYEAGALGATTDPTELLELLGVNPGPLFHARLEREVRRLLEHVGSVTTAQGAGSLDFEIGRDDKRIGVLVKSWNPMQVPTLRTVTDALRSVEPNKDLDELWLVCPQALDGVPVPAESAGVPLRAMSVHDLRRIAAHADRQQASG